ncbi:MAG: ferritin-like domain-containing protein [Acidobacteriales bacterium]|nr:ferritin-like domain-containing protein [Terriglobales bacterium]
MKMENLHDLYVEQLQDLYDAEQQLIKALPKMAQAATSEELRSGFEEHLEQTKQQAQRLERIFEELGEDAKGEKCKGMEGLIKEGTEVIENNELPAEVKDAALIAAAQRVEHYEIAGYGTVRTYANLLGEDEAAELLEQTLEEEKEADQLLTEAAESINVQAEEGDDAMGEDAEDEDEDEDDADSEQEARRQPARAAKSAPAKKSGGARKKRVA